ELIFDDLDNLILPLPLLFGLAILVFVSCMSSKSLILTFELRIPICTNRSPFLLGRDVTIPFNTKLITFTSSPILKSDALNFLVDFSLFPNLYWPSTFDNLLRKALLSSSISLWRPYSLLHL